MKNGTKTFYFDQNDNMFTEEEVRNAKEDSKLTAMVVKLPD